MKTDPRMIDIEEDSPLDNRPTDVPVFSIESIKEPGQKLIQATPRKRKGIAKRIFDYFSLIITIVCILFICFRPSNPHFEVSSSIPDAINLETLKKPYSPSSKGTVITTDSVLGVGFDMFPLNGLKASLETDIPSRDDKSVVLFLRSADYYPDGSMIGDVVMDGKKLPSKHGKSRPAYVAMSKEGALTFGISDNKKLEKYAESSGGSFFRQFVLLGDGELPSKFELHGKVERAALGRMTDGSLYYIVTHGRETMYDFADALREYGFIDAVYLTGGNNYTFYRDTLGTPHYSPRVLEKLAKYSREPLPAPLLVFRTSTR